MKLNHYSPRTIHTYRHILLNFKSFSRQKNVVKCSEITTQILDQYILYLKRRGLQSSTIKSYFKTIKSYIKFLVKQKVIHQDPSLLVILDIVPFQINPTPSRLEINKILSIPNCNTFHGLRDRTIMELAYTTGIRVFENWQLQTNHINFRKEVLQIENGKNRKDRIIPLNESITFWLKQYLKQWIERKQTNKLWITQTGGPLGYQRLEKLIPSYVKKAGIIKKYSSHSFRRAFATHLLNHGTPPATISILLGHSSMNTLRYYMKSDMNFLRKEIKKWKI
ncbi:MAG: tyrosine-type recombinase/integrase [Lentisphaeria bacterium]|nr:tyrosine-type recombinase/integrase [Lentisphaeria bacterium]